MRDFVASEKNTSNDRSNPAISDLLQSAASMNGESGAAMRNQELEQTNWARQVAVVLGALFFAGFAWSMSLPFTALYLLHDLDAGSTENAALLTALSFSAQGFAVVIFSPLWGIVADFVGRKMMLCRALAGGALVVGLMGIVNNGYQLVSLRFLQGVVAGISSAGPAMVASLAPPQRAATALGFQQSALLIATMMAPFAGGVVASTWGYRQSYVISAAFLGLAAVIVWFFVSESKDFHARKISAFSRKEFASDFTVLFHSGRLVMIALVLFGVQFSLNSINPVLPLYIQGVFGKADAAQLTGVALGLTGLLAVVGALGGGSIAERFGYRKALFIAVVGSGIVYSLHVWATGLVSFMLVRALLGIFQGAVLPTVNALVTRVVKRSQQGAAFGFTTSTAFVGIALGPLFGASISTQFGMPVLFLATGVAFVSLGFVIQSAFENITAKTA